MEQTIGIVGAVIVAALFMGFRFIEARLKKTRDAAERIGDLLLRLAVAVEEFHTHFDNRSLRKNSGTRIIIGKFSTPQKIAKQPTGH